MKIASPSDARDLLTRLYSAAIESVRGERVLCAHAHVEDGRFLYDGPGGLLDLPLPSSRGRLFVLGAGKAAASMARGMEIVLGDRIKQGCVIVKQGHTQLLERIVVREGDHPVPGPASLAATRELLRQVDATQPDDVVFFLLTGGASSLLCLPADGLDLDDKASATALLLNSGADIHEINTVRRHLSAVKGGRLRARSRAGTFCTLAISDVVGDDPAAIGSGPSVIDRSSAADALAVIERHGLAARMPARVMKHLRTSGRSPSPSQDDTYCIIASNRSAIGACVHAARSRQCDTTVFSEQMTGDTADAARMFAKQLIDLAQQASARPHVLIAGGETTLQVTGTGSGGRNQEFALRAAIELAGIPNVALLAAGTDGTDGPTDAAGAFADGETGARAARANRNIEAHLRNNDARPLLESLGDLFITGPTHTNVMDLVIGIVW